MKNYKYQLDKSSKKFICPNCSKKTFVKYVDNETNQYIDDIHGRCDREQKCRYFHKPSGNSTYTYNYVDVKPIKPSYITLNHQNNSLSNYEINPLANYLFTKFDENDVRNIFSKYKVGTSKWSNGSTRAIFFSCLMDLYLNISSPPKSQIYQVSTIDEFNSRLVPCKCRLLNHFV